MATDNVATSEPGLAIPPRPEPVPPPPVTVAQNIGDHLSAAGKDVLADALDRLHRGERVIVTSVEQLTGTSGSTVTTKDGTVQKLPRWATLAVSGFALIGGGTTAVGIFKAIHWLLPF